MNTAREENIYAGMQLRVINPNREKATVKEPVVVHVNKPKNSMIEVKSKSKSIKTLAIAGAFLLSTVVGYEGLTTYQNQPLVILENELEVHSGKSITDDGRTVTYNDDHYVGKGDCALPSPQYGTFEERVNLFCQNNGITIEQKQELVEQYPELFNDSRETLK